MSTIDSPAIGMATINAVSVDCPAKTNLTLHVGPSHAEWGGRHELDTIYCAVGVYDTVTATRKAPGSGFSLNLEGAYLGDLASSGSDFGERIEQLDDDGDIVRDLTERGFTGHLLVGAYRAELRTPEVYATFDQIGAGDGDENHLQKAAVSLHPRSGQAIEEALRAGASQAFVSGSGPSVIAFVPTEDAADAVQRTWQDSRCVDRIIATNAPARPIVHITA